MYISRRFKLIIFFVSILFLVGSVQETYGKYKSEADGTSTTSIARWNIIVNSQNIISNNQITNTLNPQFLNNPHIADGVIAPSAVGFFDVNIDCSQVDVSFNYSISTEVDPTSDVEDLKVIGYSVNGGAIIDYDGMLSDLNETIQVDAIEKTRNYRIYIKWEDETGSMNNASETLAALANGNAKINVNINFSQVVN